MKTIALLTDFGAGDYYSGSIKGAILRTNPAVQIVDISHQVPTGDVRAGAFMLLASYRHFPRGTVFVTVVDPGVGSSRAGIIVQTKNYYFVGPDNGLMSWALKREKIIRIYSLDKPKYHCRTTSKVFHGRDIFAPVAAHLTRGILPHSLGTRQHHWIQLSWPAIHRDRSSLQAAVIYIDHFGNAVTNLDRLTLERITKGSSRVRIRHKTLPLKTCYADVKVGQPVALIGSADFLELAVNQGNAAQALKLRVGDRVAVLPATNPKLRKITEK